MIKIKSSLTTVATALSVALGLCASVHGAIVYDDSSNYLGKTYTPGNGEFGDQITLGGTERLITEFQFQTFATNNVSGNLNPNAMAEVFFRINDGPLSDTGVPTPGTIFYDSGAFSLSTGFRTLTINDFGTLPVPNTFTWSVAFSGLTSDERAGLLFFDPVTTGSSFNDFWVLTPSGWNTFVVDGGAIPGNFAARLIAVPEPSTFVFGLLSGLGFLAFRRFRKA